MRAAIRLSAGILVLAVAVAPGFAKKTRPTPYSGRFLLDSGESLVTEAASRTGENIVVRRFVRFRLGQELRVIRRVCCLRAGRDVADRLIRGRKHRQNQALR